MRSIVGAHARVRARVAGGGVAVHHLLIHAAAAARYIVVLHLKRMFIGTTNLECK